MIGVLLLGLAGAVGWAATRHYTASVRIIRSPDQAFVTVNGPISTASKSFQDLLAPIARPAISNRGPITVTFSGDFTGAPVALRAKRGDRGLLKPGIAHFDPAGGPASFSFTFVSEKMRRGCRSIGIEWRSPTGSRVALNYGDYVVSFHPVDSHTICE